MQTNLTNFAFVLYYRNRSNLSIIFSQSVYHLTSFSLRDMKRDKRAASLSLSLSCQFSDFTQNPSSIYVYTGMCIYMCIYVSRRFLHYHAAANSIGMRLMRVRRRCMTAVEVNVLSSRG